MPDAEALSCRGESLSYGALQEQVTEVATGLQALGLQPGERVAIYLPKRFESVITIFATARAGGIFVPLNPLLKAPQVAHILKDSGASLLVTSKDRARLLADTLPDCPLMRQIIIVDDPSATEPPPARLNTISWQQLHGHPRHQTTALDDHHSVAILYTSGSTGRPKGVELTHRNLVTGAHSVSAYLRNSSQDRLLAVLPMSFDYGLSQLTSAFHSGASVVLMEYLLPREVIKTLSREHITGLAGVPSLWMQLADLDWPEQSRNKLRFITNSGGAMPQLILKKLQKNLPQTEIFLMYGLTEAFRSTYLHPQELKQRPESIGKAIPQAQISVLREDGTPCAAGEPGELVHAGPLVAKGYWNNIEASRERFRPLTDKGEKVVWSGDSVSMDEDGFLYFLGRKDEQIKTSGYRVSPTEIEEVLYDSGLVLEAAVIGIPDPMLGQAIIAFVLPLDGVAEAIEEELRTFCKKELPAYMLPQNFTLLDALPKTPHGKIDRQRLGQGLHEANKAVAS